MAGRGFWKWLGSQLTSPIRPRLIAWLATIASIGLLQISSGNSRMEDLKPEVLVLWATLIALIWTAFHTYRVVDQARAQAAEDKRSRREISAAMRSAVISELEEFNVVVRSLSSSPEIGDQHLLPTAQLSRALDHPELFRAADMAVLSKVDFLLRHHQTSNTALMTARKLAKMRLEDPTKPAQRDTELRALESKSLSHLARVVDQTLRVLKEEPFFSLRDLQEASKASSAAGAPASPELPRPS